MNHPPRSGVVYCVGIIICDIIKLELGGSAPCLPLRGLDMTAYTFTPTTVTHPGEEPQEIDANFLTIEEIEAIAYDSPKGTTVSTRRGVFTCNRYDSGFSMWTSDGGNFADAFMVHVIITEHLPVV